MSGGGGQAPAVPSTTTTVNDIPAWEQGYVTDLLGQAQSIAAQPYQQFPGQQIAGFTPDQTQAFSNIENMGNVYQPTQNAALGSSVQGANTAGSIYGAGAGDINAAAQYNPLQAVAPYLGAASQYNSASAAQPWLNQAAGYQSAAANTATPQGIQSYMSPYTNDVVNGIQNEANLNWNQNIMPGVNDKFVGSGQYGSGRNAQVLGQAAGNFQTGLSANVANALESGYNTAGNQAATQANLLSGLGNQSISGANAASSAQGAQVSNLLNQGQAAGTATQQQAGNLLNAGTTLGNLAATQGTEQLAAGTNLQNLANSEQGNALTNAQALQGVGQQQQQLNQANINTAQQNWQNQVNYPAQQTEYLNQIIRGLPAPTASTSSSQTTPAYSVSPLAGIGGAGTGALSLLGNNGQTIGTAVKRGGLIKGYAMGGQVTDDYDSMDDGSDDTTPLDYASYDTPATAVDLYGDQPDATDQYTANGGDPSGNNSPLGQAVSTPQQASPLAVLDTPDSKHNNINPNEIKPSGTLTQSQMQQNQLLALARGMLTPTLGGSPWASLGQGIGAAQDVGIQQQKWNAQQNALDYTRQLEAKKIGIEQQSADQRGQYYKDSVKAREDAIKARNNGQGGVTQGIISHLMAENPDLTYEDALALAKRGGSSNTNQDEIRKERLALDAYKNGIAIKGNPNPSLDDYRNMYGVKAKKSADSNAIKPSQTDIDYLKLNPAVAPKFESRFGEGSASQYLGQ